MWCDIMWPGGHRTTDARCALALPSRLVRVCVLNTVCKLISGLLSHSCLSLSLSLGVHLSRVSWQTVSNNPKWSDYLVGRSSHLRAHDSLPKEKSQCPLQVCDSHRQTRPQEAHMKRDLRKSNAMCLLFLLYLSVEDKTAKDDFLSIGTRAA